MVETIITGCKVLQGEPGGYVLEWKDVLVEDGVIKRVDDKRDLDGNLKVIDGKNTHILLPGFIDNHIHSRMIDHCVHHPWNDKSIVPDLYHQCRKILERAYREAKDSGTVLLMDYPEYPFDFDLEKDNWKMPFEVMRQEGLRGVVRVLLSHDKIPESSFLKKTLEELVLCDIKRIKMAEDSFPESRVAVWIPEEKWFNERRGWKEEVSMKVIKYLQGLYEQSDENVYFVMHCAETKIRTDEIRELGYENGVDFLLKNGLLGDRTVLVHCRYGIRDEDVEYIKEAGSRVVVRPSKKEYNGEMSVCPLQEFINKGVIVGFGTDVPVVRKEVRRGFEIIPEIYNAMDIYDINFQTSYDIATRGGARVFGFDGMGKIENGYNASLLMFDVQEDLRAREEKRKPYLIQDLEKALNKSTLRHVSMNS